MDELRVWRRSLVLVGLSLLAGWIWIAPFASTSAASGVLSVSFLDVGQGDAILIESPTGQQMLVDGGRDSSVLRALGRELPFFDRHLEYVLATHPDQDHIGGLIDVLNRYAVDTIVTTDNQADSATAAAYAVATNEEGAHTIVAKRGTIFDLGGGVVVEVLWPMASVKDEERNASSIVLQVRYGEIAILLTGDVPKRIEEYLVLAYGEHLKSDVLKVGHHGSRTSTAELFVAEVAPTYAVISAGADNSYGHPHVEVTDTLFNAGVEVFETATVGTVTFLSDGTEVWRE